MNIDNDGGLKMVVQVFLRVECGVECAVEGCGGGVGDEDRMVMMW